MPMHSTATIAEWLERTKGHEGGYSDNRHDPGNWTGGKVGQGELKGTKWGIAANTYGHLDIKSLTADEAADIYVRDYLLPLRADQYGPALAYQMFDLAINSGVPQARLLLQRALGVKQDGIIGPVTLAAIPSDGEAALALLVERLDFLVGLGSWMSFGRGWARRIAKNARYIFKDAEAV